MLIFKVANGKSSIRRGASTSIRAGIAVLATGKAERFSPHGNAIAAKVISAAVQREMAVDERQRRLCIVADHPGWRKLRLQFKRSRVGYHLPQGGGHRVLKPAETRSCGGGFIPRRGQLVVTSTDREDLVRKAGHRPGLPTVTRRHLVPLSRQAVALLREIRKESVPL